MFGILPLLSIALVAASSVSALVLPRHRNLNLQERTVAASSSEPAGWSSSLEDYETYHIRYMALDCEGKHNTALFTTCCHPRQANAVISKIPSSCFPSSAALASASAEYGSGCGEETSSVAPPPASSPKPTSTAKTTPAAPTTTKHSSSTSSHKTTSTKTTSSKTAAPTSGSGSNTGGVATYYTQNGEAGACGTVHSDSALIAAIDQSRYGSSDVASSLCGKQVKITNTKNQKTVTVTIQDDCPTCLNSNSIDLSVGAFTQIATKEEGEVPIVWEFL